jgi:hypothetical protein
MKKPTKREEYIDFFEELDDDYTYFDDPNRLDIYIISSNGLYKGFSMYVSPVDGPNQVPAKEHTAITAAIDANEDLEEFDEDHVAMVKSGCAPEEDCYRWSSDFSDGFDEGWYTRDEILNDLEEAITSNVHPERWDQMDEEGLVYWYEKLMEIGNGLTIKDK